MLPELLALDGDRGAAELLRGAASGMVHLCRANPCQLLDIDTPQALRAAQGS